MLVEDKGEDTFIGTSVKGDKLTLHHEQDISDVLHSCHKERQSDHNGFSDGRGMRKIATIPPLDAVRLAAERPGFFNHSEMVKHWLKSDEGERFLTVKRNSI